MRTRVQTEDVRVKQQRPFDGMLYRSPMRCELRERDWLVRLIGIYGSGMTQRGDLGRVDDRIWRGWTRYESRTKKKELLEVRTGKSPPNMNTVWDGLSFRCPVSFCFVTVHTGQRKIAARSAVLLLLFFAAPLFVVFCHRNPFCYSQIRKGIDVVRHPRSACRQYEYELVKWTISVFFLNM